MDVIQSTSRALLKDTITMKFIPLCDAIECNDSFLTGLCINGIITKGFKSEVKSLHSNLEKVSKVLEFLKQSRTDADFTTFLDILKRSCNSKALEIITEQIKLPSSTTSYGYQGVVPGYVERKEQQKLALAHLKSVPNRDTQITFPVVVLHGFGGNGKSQLARRLVQILKKEFKDGCNIMSSAWINAVNKTSVIEGFQNFANVSKDLSLSDLMEGIYTKLKDEYLLLVFDDGDDFEMLKTFLPLNGTETNVMVIITAHCEWVICDENVKNIPVSNFTLTEFGDFVSNSINKKICDQDWKQLKGHTGRIPAIVWLVCKGFAQRVKRDSSYTITKYFEKFQSEIFTFGEDGECIPGLKESDYKKSAKAVVEQQLRCMKNWDGYDTQKLKKLTNYILNCITYCDPLEISEQYFFMKHPQILQEAGEDYGEVRQALGILKEFGWIELVCVDGIYNANEKLLAYTIHECYQIGLKSALNDKEKEHILQAMIEYMQTIGEATVDFLIEKHQHQRFFWPCVTRYDSLIYNHAIRTYHCLNGLIMNCMNDDVRYLAGAYQDKEQLVDELFRHIEVIGISSMHYVARRNDHQLVHYLLSEIEKYYNNVQNSEKKAWIRHQLMVLVKVQSLQTNPKR